MVWGSFGKILSKSLPEAMVKIWRNTAELPIRAMEIGEKLGIVNQNLTNVVDNVLYKPVRQMMDPKGELINKPEYTKKKLLY